MIAMKRISHRIPICDPKIVSPLGHQIPQGTLKHMLEIGVIKFLSYIGDKGGPRERTRSEDH